MAKFAHICLALLISFLLATVFIAEGRPTPNGKKITHYTKIPRHNKIENMQ